MPIAKLCRYKSVVPRDTEEFFRNFLSQVLSERKDQPRNYKDFIQMMIDAEAELETKDSKDAYEGKAYAEFKKKGLTNDDILAQCFLFFTAGYETTGTTLGFIMYNLATNPDVQDKVHAEIDEICGDIDTVEYKDIPKLTYMEQVINETLRLFPPITRLDRVAAVDVEYEGFKIPKQTLVTYPIRAIQMDPDNYNNPEKFDPDRFSPEEKNKRDPLSFLPFGAGPRACIGVRLAMVEMKMVAALIVKSFRILPTNKTPNPLVLEKKFFPTVKGGTHLRVERR